MRDSVILYQSQYDAIKDLPLEDKGRLLDAIFATISGESVSLPPTLDLAFRFIKSQIERDQSKYQTICEKRKAAGQKGGLERAKQMQANQANATKCKQIKQVQANQADNDTVSDTDTDTVSDTDINKKVSDKSDRKKKIFSKPTISEINSYIAEMGYNIDSERFYNYYESNGWKVGRNPMKSWQAALRTWSRGGNENKRDSNTFGREPMPTHYDVNDFKIK